MTTLTRFQSTKTRLVEFFRRRPVGVKPIYILIFVTGLIAFGVKTLELGFFHDDWHHIYYSYYYGLEGLKQFLFYDSRPFASAVYWPLFSAIGHSAFNWHLFTLLARVLVVLAFLACLNLAWPKQKKGNSLVAILFLIYPVFQAQPNSVSYALHWVGYLAFMLSLLFMILAVKKSKFRLPFIGLSLLLEVFHLLMLEYFAGIELARPILLWLLFSELSSRERLRKVFVYWLPYLVILIAYTFFRASFSDLWGYDRNTPVVLLGLFSEPLSSILFLVQSLLRDFADILLSTWNATYDLGALDFSIFTNLWVWALALWVGLVSWFVFRRVDRMANARKEDSDWAKYIFIFGLVFVALGLLPSWISGRSFSLLNVSFNDRFALPSMLGASMAWVGGIFYLVRKPSYGVALICTLVGLAVGLQLRTNNQYARAWEKQQQFYWQLFWRAPSIEPGTALVSEGEFLTLMGVHPTTYAINSLYMPSDSSQEFNFAFFPAGRVVDDPGEFRQGVELTDTRFGTVFKGSSANSITLYFLPEKSQCLWILRPEDARIRNLPELTTISLPASNIDRIYRSPESDSYPPRDLFGPEPEHTWCFYYEKADLARQFGDWETVTALWDEAEQRSLEAGSGPEFIVFIEGFAYAGDWDRAAELTRVANRYGENIRPALCELWGDLLETTVASSERQAAVAEVTNRLNCGPFMQ